MVGKDNLSFENRRHFAEPNGRPIRAVPRICIGYVKPILASYQVRISDFLNYWLFWKQCSLDGGQ